MPFSVVLSLALIICTSVTTQSYPNSILASQNVAIFGPKILAVLKRRGKNFVFSTRGQQVDEIRFESHYKTQNFLNLIKKVSNLPQPLDVTQVGTTCDPASLRLRKLADWHRQSVCPNTVRTKSVRALCVDSTKAFMMCIHARSC